MKNIFKNNYVNSLLTKAFVVFLGILTTVIINRYLGPAGRGEYAYILNIVNILVLLLNLGLYQSYPYYRKNIEEQAKSKYYNMFLIQFTVYFLIFVLIALILESSLFLILSVLIPLMILSTQLRFISLIENINKRNFINVINQLIYVLILLVVVTLFDANYIYILISILIKELISILIYIKKFNYKFNLRLVDKKTFKTSITVGIFPMFTSLLLSLNYKVDILILELFVSFDEMGYYAVGVALASQIWIIPDAFKDVIFSRVAKSDSILGILLSIKINIYVSIIITLILIFSGKHLIVLLYGDEFIMAYEILTLIFIGIFPMIFFKLINPLFNVKGLHKFSFYILLISVIFNIVLNFILIPLWGIHGAAISSIFSYTLCGFIFVSKFLKENNLHFKLLFIFTKDEIYKMKTIIKR